MPNEANEVGKSKTVYTDVTLSDGRAVKFPGKRKVLKETLIDETKIVAQDGNVLVADGAVSLRMDFLHGATRTIPLPAALIAKFAGHGAEQKFGDELASPADKPLSPEDMEAAIDDLAERIGKGEWTTERAAGGGFSGASIVVRAIMQAYGKTQEEVKAFIDGQLEAAKQKGDPVSRPKLYAAFRASKKLGPVIKQLEEEEAAKKGQDSKAVEAAESALAGLGDGVTEGQQAG